MKANITLTLETKVIEKARKKFGRGISSRVQELLMADLGMAGWKR